MPPPVPFKDHFSKQAADYAKFRPRYPQALFSYLGTITPSRRLAWDCATGNGQAAVQLATVFDRVIATDASEKQVASAEPRPNIDYRMAPAENSGLDSSSVDLIMVAQALHWFDLDRFYDEAKRVLKPAGAIAASAYNLLHIEPEIDAIVNRYYTDVVGPYWPPERLLVERFAELPFPFQELTPPTFEMTAQWNCDHLLGYLWTWSSTQRFVASQNRNPLEAIADDLRAAWGAAEKPRLVAWPLSLRVGIHHPRE